MNTDEQVLLESFYSNFILTAVSTSIKSLEVCNSHMPTTICENAATAARKYLVGTISH